MVPITSSISTPAVVLRRGALRQVPNTLGLGVALTGTSTCIVEVSYLYMWNVMFIIGLSLCGKSRNFDSV